MTTSRSQFVAAHRVTCRALLIIPCAYLASVLTCASAQTPADLLSAGFQDPPNSARPIVWWHWMNGNITKEGIRLDLNWMHRVGLGGFQSFDGDSDTPQVVDRRLVYMTPEWQDAFRFATTYGEQLGFEQSIASSPGWSESGGPWVPPSHGMKKYVWSETVIRGGKPFTGKLLHPPSNTGPFQGMPMEGGPTMTGAERIPWYYADSVVIAYRRPIEDISLTSLHPKVSSSSGTLNYAVLADGDFTKTIQIPIPQRVGETSWIQYEFAKRQTVSAVTLATIKPDGAQAALDDVGVPNKIVEASDDGQHFREIARLAGGKDTVAYPPPEYTLAFAPSTAKYFRVSFQRTEPAPHPAWAVASDPNSGKKSLPPTNYESAELVLHGDARVNRWAEKAAFVPTPDLDSLATNSAGDGRAIAKASVVDLTAKMRPNGTLDWTPPAGDWIVLRFGYSLLGISNHPATAEATGLEVDKLDHRFVKQYLDTYLQRYKEAVGPALIGKKGIHYIVSDSWEAGTQNWTDRLLEEFQKRRGYDPIPWMPVLTGRVVDSGSSSDRFLWDFRKTLADLMAEEHYGEFEKTLHEWGMAHYGESHEWLRQFIGDGMEVKKFDEVPMGAMWTYTPEANPVQYGYNADDRESASVAHIYGQNIAAAESLSTSAALWAWSPATLKPTVDQEFLNGINRIVIHESALQPLIDKAPGMTLGNFGQSFNRNETWAEQAHPWVDYLARTSFLLQQGHFVSDIIYFYGEDSNLTAIFSDSAPHIPRGYAFDYINADGLIHELSVSDGHITTHSGMNYRVLALDPRSRHMSLPVLRAIHRLVEQGGVVAGAKPIDDPSLADDEAEFRKLSDELFGSGTGTHPVGRGKVYADQDLTDVLKALGMTPDFDATQPMPNASLEFVHRHLTEGDLYFIDNRSERDVAVDASFRVTGKAPEFWRAEDASRKPASFRKADGCTIVPLKLEPWGTVFVLFRTPTIETSRHLVPVTERLLATVDGDWQIHFQPGRGAPDSVGVHRLESWTSSSDPGVKYFSGIGTYAKKIHAEAAWLVTGARVWLNLGEVKNLAEVSVNGKSMGVVWHSPYRVDVTSAIKPGANELSIKVVNAWVNRLIGDQQPGLTAPITFADVKPYRTDSPLLPSGLLGPVTLEMQSAVASARHSPNN
jgi:hypothetical protein